MKLLSVGEELRNNSYPGRGIIIGKTPDGKKAVTAYFIMGRSENSRNRIFVEDGEGIRTQAFDPSKLIDPSLIIYAPVRVLGNKTIVTNGDQTDTIYEGMDKQLTFEQSLRTREFEPDAPNYTPRISGILHMSTRIPIPPRNSLPPSCRSGGWPGLWASPPAARATPSRPSPCLTAGPSPSLPEPISQAAAPR